MGHYIQDDLASQQEALSSSNYDLRITNLAKFIYRKLPKKSGKLIDIGAGNGLQLRFFRKKGLDVTGMELSPALCEAMKKNPAMAGISIFQGDITKKKGNNNYDFVLATDVIEHIEDDIDALKNLYSFVAPGGLLIISVPAHEFLYGKRDKAWGHYRRYDKRDLLYKLSQLDGKIEFITYWNIIGYFAYFFYEKILQKPIKEGVRYNNNFLSRSVRSFLDLILRLEEIGGGSAIGLSLVIGLKKI